MPLQLDDLAARKSQFNIKHLMLVVFLCALALALGRVVLPPPDDFLQTTSLSKSVPGSASKSSRMSRKPRVVISAVVAPLPSRSALVIRVVAWIAVSTSLPSARRQRQRGSGAARP